jgi:hypothetical protein
LLSTASSLTESLIYIIFGMLCLYDSPSGLFYTLYRLTLRFSSLAPRGLPHITYSHRDWLGILCLLSTSIIAYNFLYAMLVIIYSLVGYIRGCGAFMLYISYHTPFFLLHTKYVILEHNHIIRKQK